MSEVNEALRDTKKDVAKLLDMFKKVLTRERKKIDWGHVGSMVEVRKQLTETLAFISNRTVNDIIEQDLLQ